MISVKFKNLFYITFASVCLFLLGISIFNYSLFPDLRLKVFAETVNSTEYFSAKVENTEYKHGQTVFLNSGQTLQINFGKPVGEPYGTTENVFISQEEIGKYALSFISGSFNLSINGILVDTGNYINNNKFSVKQFIYSPEYETNPDSGTEFQYLTISIDLSDSDFFQSGEYIITFNNYIEFEHNGADYKANQPEKNFSATFYVFKTTEYFVSEDARDAKIEKQNLREVPKVDVNYKNYYYFNYSNYTSVSSLYNFLPSISFDANKFIIEISKSYQGVTQTCTVSKFASNYVTLGTNTLTEFLFVTYNSESNNLSITFKDLGEYSINYKFIYTKSHANYENLTNANIATFKKDMLYVFGYQMFYSNISTQQKSEFKYVEDGKTNASADVSYMLPSQNLKSTDIGTLASDDLILNALNGKTSASSNQPVISVQYNVSLNKNSSYYYVWDSKTNDWKKENDAYIKKPYTNSAFADAGKYLLKVIYSYDKNLTENGIVAPNEYFVQYFYFTITNTITSFSVKEIITDETTGDTTENALSTNSYTQNPVKVVLSGQSRFNSDVRLVIESKGYASNLYTPDMILYGSATEQVFNTSRNLNYKVTLHFGGNKTQTSYFTIDNTDFQNVQILNVKKSVSSSSYYVKDSEVSFFTNQAVTLQWSEKLSGANSTAYSKFIPFKSTEYTSPNLNQFVSDLGIPTNYSLNFSVLDKPAFTRYYNSKNMSLITDKYVFSQQGLYIIYLTDQAGNDEYISFCIDKTEIIIWQFSIDKYQTVQRYNVVSADTTLQWGRYKLINMGITHNQLDSVADEWVKKVIKDKLQKDDDIKISSFSSDGLLYLAPEIHKTMYLQEGSSYIKLENQISYFIEPERTINETKLAIEMTYVFYFIDESNPYYNKVNTLSVADFANYASKNYSITTSSDASQADIVFNSSGTSSDDYSNINFNSANLSQAGFTDSYSYASDEYSDKLDIRSKYYYATGTTTQGNVSLLSYIFIKNPSEKIIMDKVAIYYYSFIKTSDNQYKLSDTAIETIIYDRASNLDFTNGLSGDFTGFQAYNINPEFNLALNQYQTKEGKYVIVRTYTAESIVEEFDFLTRESVFVIDRQNIVSSPVPINDELISIIGQFIHINVLDGDVNKVKFDDLYMAYYNSGEILETNKLPVVSYVPVSKYGTGTDTNFSFYDALQYFYTMTSDNENYYLKRFQTDLVNEQSKLGLSYFGQNLLVKENFGNSNNLKNINNSSFDLTVKIEYATEKNAERTLVYTGTSIKNGYFNSSNFSTEGYYYVTLTQNYANGNTYPNVRNTFSFMFYISRLAPQFDFLDSNDEVLNNMDNGEYNISYTNENSVKVSWTDHSSEFMAKININADEKGNAKGIWYYTSANSTKKYIPVSSIVTNDKNHYFILNIANIANSTIVYVYMEYEGSIPNNYSKITKALYIDRQAPTKVLNELIASTETNGIAVGSYSRVYVDENNILTTEKRYNVPINYALSSEEGPLAFYTFAVELTTENLNRLFTTQSPVGNYYTEGYYYYAKLIGSSGNMSVTNIGSAKNAFITHSEYFVVTSLNVGRIYEIVEQDLAGNITIYTIYFVLPNSDENVLEFTKPATEHNSQTSIKYGNLQETQNIFAKDNFEMTNINLYNYEWLVINVNGTTYLTTPYIDKNSYYDISNWTDRTKNPNIYTLSEILTFTNSRSVQKLVVVEPCKNFNYNFNISVTNEILSSDSLSGSLEGIKIKGNSYQNGIAVYLSTIQIYSWGNLTYNKIYDATTTFSSNNYVTFTGGTNEWTFSINQPAVAYKYIFVDNYGVSYVHYHTVGQPVINEEDRITGDVEQVSILNDDGLGSTLWYVGYNNMSYYYSVVDYYIYIKVLYLDYNPEAKIFSWKTFDPAGATNEYGTFLEKGMSSSYYSCVSVSGQPSINCINLFASASTLNLNAFQGSAVKFIITLVNVNENPTVALDPSNIIQAHILINNLNPIIELFDKNNENKSSLFDGNTLFSGQLTIRYGSLNFNNQAIFPFKIALQINNDEVPINSGTVVNNPGFYIVKTYITINNFNYLYKTQAFIISESSKDFYSVVVLNSQSGIWEPKAPTGKTFKYNNETYSSHYIVNNDNYKISINEEQDIEVTELGFTYNRGGTLTRFYKISNLGSQSKSINFYEKTVAVTFAKTENLITTAFYYMSADGQQYDLNGISTQIIITTNNQNFVSSRIIYNSYFGIPENKIDITVYFGETQPQLYLPVKQVISETTSAIILTEPGTYNIYLSDQAGNKHSFKDEQYNYPSSSYQILYINGVMYQINGKQPIENGIYNDKVEITLPTTFDTLYDPGGKPVISVFRNGVEMSVSAVNGKYTLNQPGYYQVYFKAKIGSNDVRHQSYSFTILDSTEARWAFEFSEFANYEITSVKKNGSPIDLSKYFKYNTYQMQNNDTTVTVKYLKNIFISLFDETTGAGNYEITIRTNVGIEGQAFTFNFKIKDTSILPITISVLEGTATTGNITVNFNALILFNTVGNCTVKIDDRTSIVLNSESINELADYNITREITKNGTSFVQIITSSGKVVYSYKIIKEEPLNAVSIIIIIVSVLAVSGLIVTITLLRRRMKIR